MALEMRRYDKIKRVSKTLQDLLLKGSNTRTSAVYN